MDLRPLQVWAFPVAVAVGGGRSYSCLDFIKSKRYYSIK